MSLNHTRARLNGLSRQLHDSWLETKEVWRDRKCEEFEQRYIKPLFDAVSNATTSIEDLEKRLKKLKEDCEI